MNFSKFLKKYSWLLGLLLFGVILSRSNIGQLLAGLTRIKPLYLTAALLLALPMLIIKSYCWSYIMSRQKIEYRLRDSFLIYCSSVFIGYFTPGRIGEATRALYLKKDGYSWGKSLVSVLLDRLTDLLILLGLSIAGSFLFFSLLQKQVLILLAGATILILLAYLSFKRGVLEWLAKITFDLLVPEKYKNSWSLNSRDFIQDLKIYSFKNYAVILFITSLSWLFYYCQMFLLAKSISINVPFLYLALITTIAGLITVLPISISGIGTRDAALIAFLAPYSIVKEQAVIFSALILFIALFSVFIGLICWFIKPIKLNS